MRRLLPLIFAAVLSLPLRAVVSTNIDMPVAFDLTSAQCSQLPSDVHGEGTIHIVSSVNQDAKGVWHTTVIAVAHGSATDASGTVYRFNYANHFSFTGLTADGQPPDAAGSNSQPPLNLTDTDSFTLEAQGKAGAHIKAHFVVRLKVDANFITTLDSFRVVGELGCDPI